MQGEQSPPQEASRKTDASGALIDDREGGCFASDCNNSNHSERRAHSELTGGDSQPHRIENRSGDDGSSAPPQRRAAHGSCCDGCRVAARAEVLLRHAAVSWVSGSSRSPSRSGIRGNGESSSILLPDTKKGFSMNAGPAVVARSSATPGDATPPGSAVMANADAESGIQMQVALLLRARSELLELGSSVPLQCSSLVRLLRLLRPLLLSAHPAQQISRQLQLLQQQVAWASSPSREALKKAPRESSLLLHFAPTAPAAALLRRGSFAVLLHAAAAAGLCRTHPQLTPGLFKCLCSCAATLYAARRAGSPETAADAVEKGGLTGQAFPETAARIEETAGSSAFAISNRDVCNSDVDWPLLAFELSLLPRIICSDGTAASWGLPGASVVAGFSRIPGARALFSFIGSFEGATHGCSWKQRQQHRGFRRCWSSAQAGSSTSVLSVAAEDSSLWTGLLLRGNDLFATVGGPCTQGGPFLTRGLSTISLKGSQQQSLRTMQSSASVSRMLLQQLRHQPLLGHESACPFPLSRLQKEVAQLLDGSNAGKIGGTEENRKLEGPWERLSVFSEALSVADTLLPETFLCKSRATGAGGGGHHEDLLDVLGSTALRCTYTPCPLLCRAAHELGTFATAAAAERLLRHLELKFKGSLQLPARLGGPLEGATDTCEGRFGSSGSPDIYKQLEATGVLDENQDCDHWQWRLILEQLLEGVGGSRLLLQQGPPGPPQLFLERCISCFFPSSSGLVALLKGPQGMYLQPTARALAVVLLVLLPHALENSLTPPKPCTAAYEAARSAAPERVALAAGGAHGGMHRLFGLRCLLGEIAEFLLYTARRDGNKRGTPSASVWIGSCSTECTVQSCRKGSCSYRSTYSGSNSTTDSGNLYSRSTVRSVTTGGHPKMVESWSPEASTTLFSKVQLDAGDQQRALFAVYGEFVGILSRRRLGVQLLQQEGLLRLLLLLSAAGSPGTAALAALVPQLSLEFDANREVVAEALQHGAPELQLAILAHWSCQPSCCCMQQQQAQTPEWHWKLQQLQQSVLAAAGASAKIPESLKLLLLRSKEGVRQLAAEGWVQLQLRQQSLLLWGGEGDASPAPTASAQSRASEHREKGERQPLPPEEALQRGGLARIFCGLPDEALKNSGVWPVDSALVGDTLNAAVGLPHSAGGSDAVAMAAGKLNAALIAAISSSTRSSRHRRTPTRPGKGHSCCRSSLFPPLPLDAWETGCLRPSIRSSIESSRNMAGFPAVRRRRLKTASTATVSVQRLARQRLLLQAPAEAAPSALSQGSPLPSAELLRGTP
ncbi:hypothetical protein cyc_07957 [Cyclospora cayetanensis]|uniref:Uncharacterized protein n=1 Tax=Cyclospora cayetanensis TaxID=88456 RepID=A0A1D3D2L9_9EIME|nr:hypothetical protein cyc_07957 [Cyclospora cayetanensis]